MVQRRRLHKIYDALKCSDALRSTIIDKNGFAGDKNLILKDCILSTDQIKYLKSGVLMKRIESLSQLLEKHIAECEACKDQFIKCAICFAGYPEYEISIGT